MKKQKRIRLLTNRDFDNATGFEYIEMEEIDGKQYLYWRCGETRTDEEGRTVTAEGCFPVSVDIVRERFQELGREYLLTGRELAKTAGDLLIK